MFLLVGQKMAEASGISGKLHDGRLVDLGSVDLGTQLGVHLFACLPVCDCSTRGFKFFM